jgi:hypothetical protein
MLHSFARAALSVAVLLVPAAVIASDRIPVENFARHATLTMPRLSPDGQHLAVDITDADGGAHVLVIYKVADMKQPVSMLRLPKYELPVDITWVSNTRLVVAKGRKFGSIDQPMRTGEIIATGDPHQWLGQYRRAADPGQWPFLHGHPELGQRRLQHAIRR